MKEQEKIIKIALDSLRVRKIKREIFANCALNYNEIERIAVQIMFQVTRKLFPYLWF